MTEQADGWRVHPGREHGKPDHGEPADGWVTSTEKYDTEISALSLCRFSGDRLGLGAPCAVRLADRHPDVECTTIFISAKAFEEKTLDLTPILAYQRGDIDGADMPYEVRSAPTIGGESSGVVSGG